MIVKRIAPSLWRQFGNLALTPYSSRLASHESESPRMLIQQAWRHRWVRFLVMGAVNTGFSYGIYAVLVYFGLNYALSNLASLVLGILFSFRTQSKFVFQHVRPTYFCAT